MQTRFAARPAALLTSFLGLLLAVALLPALAGSAPAAAAPSTGFSVRAVDPSGVPLERVRWNVYSRPVGGAWDQGLQYGPLETGPDGRMSYEIQDGKEYTVCLFDDVYDDNFGAGPQRPNRYATRCLGDAPDLTSATAWQPSTAQPVLDRDITLPLVGKSMLPGLPEPTGTGVAAVGTPITINPGVWSPGWATLSWQWKYWDGQELVTIPGATGATYTPTAAVAGKRLIATITGSAPGYAPATATWGANTVGATAPTMTGSLSITGALTVGSTVTAHAGTFSPAGTDTTWWWYLDGRPIFGAQGQDIEITADMLGRRLEARVIAYNWAATDNQYYNRVAVAVPGALKGSDPFITGTPVVGRTLSAKTGTWTTGASLSYQWLRAGAAISGATAATYTATAADQGKVLSVRVTGKLSGYTDVVKTSTATAPVAPAAFTTVPTPTIGGTPKVDGTLTATAGTWVPAATTSYQWFSGGVAISGATQATYSPTAAVLGKTITVKVTGTRAGYASQTKASAATAAVARAAFTTVPTPTVTGTPVVGSTLTADPGTWTPAATPSYQWFSGGVAISGATQATYSPTAADLDKTITVQVTGTRVGYESQTKTSAATAAVAGAEFTTVPTPTIVGTPKVGLRLAAQPGVWAPEATTTTYQWFRSGVAIRGATGRAYKPVAADAGRRLTVQVTGVRAGLVTTNIMSAATTAVRKGTFVRAPAPRIRGTLRVGRRLTVLLGTWSPRPTRTTYQWYRNGRVIKGARRAAYQLVRADRGKRIHVIVKRVRPGYVLTAKRSVATTRIR